MAEAGQSWGRRALARQSARAFCAQWLALVLLAVAVVALLLVSRGWAA